MGSLCSDARQTSRKNRTECVMRPREVVRANVKLMPASSVTFELNVHGQRAPAPKQLNALS